METLKKFQMNIQNQIKAKIDSMGAHSSLSIQDKIGILFFIIVVFIVIISVSVYRITAPNNKDKNAENMLEIRNTLDTNNIVSTKFQDYRLGDYYIMSSYNSCCGGEYDRDIVDVNTLSEIISMGVRFLDFEVYSFNGNTVIASSANDNIYQKGSFNEIPIAKVFDMIQLSAFGHITPNSEDPLFLHFRIKSNQKRVFSDIANQIKEKLKGKLLDAAFSYANRNNKIYNTKMSELKRKVVICVQCDDTFFKQSSLFEYTNIHTGSGLSYHYRFQDITNFINPEELINKNRHYMSVVTPNIPVNKQNMNAVIPMEYGCHFVCMKFQYKDSYLEHYVKQFNDNESAFLLRPKDIRENTMEVKVDKYEGNKGALNIKVKPTVMGDLEI